MIKNHQDNTHEGTTRQSPRQCSEYFEISAEVHKALTELKAYQSHAETLMAQALLIKKNAVITVVNRLHQGKQIRSGAVMGGLLGAWFGVTCYPLGDKLNRL